MLIRCPICKKETELEHVERGRHIECVCHARFTLDDATVVADYSKIDEPPPEKIGDYRIDRFIGRGGMGKVYKGRHPTLGIPVAVKTLLPEYANNPDFRDRFNKSAKICAKLDHPNIVRIYDFGTTDDGTVYLVMEYIAGGTLYDLLARSGPLNPRKAAEIAAAVCSGLTAAWKSGIVHRDIKPDNIMITSNGEYKLSDLGLAKFEPVLSQRPASGFLIPRSGKANETLELSAIGTPEYMAPEQSLDAKNCDIRADIYSLGITLYQLLADRLPFIASSRAELRRMHLEEEPKVPGFYRPDLPIDLEYIVMRCMQKRKTDRYQTPDELRIDLQAFLDGEPLPSTAGSAPQQKTPKSPPPAPPPLFPSGKFVRSAILPLITVGAIVALLSLLPRENRTEPEKESAQDIPAQTSAPAKATRSELWLRLKNGADSAIQEKTGFFPVIANLKMFENDSDEAIREEARTLIEKLQKASDQVVGIKMEELDKAARPLLQERRFREAREIYSHVHVPGLAEETRQARERRLNEIDEKIRLRAEQIRKGRDFLETDVLPYLAAGKYTEAKKQYESPDNPDPDPGIAALIGECAGIPYAFAENQRSRIGESAAFEFQNEPLISLSLTPELKIREITPPEIVLSVRDKNYSFSLGDLTPREQALELEKLSRISQAAKILWKLNTALAADPESARLPDSGVLHENLMVSYAGYIKRRIEKKQEAMFRKDLLELLQAQGWSSDVPSPEELSQLEILPPQASLAELIRKYEKAPSLERYISALRCIGSDPAEPPQNEPDTSGSPMETERK